MNRDRAGIAASHVPSNSNARHPRKPLKAATPPTTATPPERPQKPTALVSKPSTPAPDTRQRPTAATNANPATTTTTTTTSSAKATTTASNAAHKGRQKGIHALPSTSPAHGSGAANAETPTAATVVAATATAAPPLLTKRQSGQARAVTPGITTAAAVVKGTMHQVPTDRRSRSVSVSRKRTSKDLADAKTRTAGVKLPPLPRDGEASSPRSGSNSPSTGKTSVSGASPTHVVPSPRESAFTHNRTSPPATQVATHPTANASSSGINSHTGIPSAGTEVLAPLKQSPSLVPISSASNNTSTPFAGSTPQELRSRTASKLASMSGGIRTPTSQQSSSASYSASLPQSGTNAGSPAKATVSSTFPQPPTGSATFLVSLVSHERGQRDTVEQTTEASSVADLLVVPSTVTGTTSNCTSVTTATTVRSAMVKKKSPKAVGGAAKKTTKVSSDDEAVSEEVSATDEEEEREEKEGETSSDGDGEVEDEGDDDDDGGGGLADSTEGSEDEEDDEVEDSSDEDDEEEDDASTEEESDSSSSDSSSESVDSDKEEEPREKRRGGRQPTKAAAAAVRANGKAPGKATRPSPSSTRSSSSPLGTAQGDGKTKKKGRGEAPTRICTKISREGDVNVKVVYAVRSRHCFNRFVREIMTRFGFAKATDFDMYCIDTSGDRVDIDVEEDFDQLLDAFEATMAANSPDAQDTPARFLFSTTAGSAGDGGSGRCSVVSPDERRSRLTTFPAASGPLRASRLQSVNHGPPTGGSLGSLFDQNTTTTNNNSMSGGGGGGGGCAGYDNGNSSYASTHTSGSPRPPPMEDDGKSSASVLRLYVRYSNAYHVEHGFPEYQRSPNAAASLYASPTPPTHITDSNVASFFTNQLQQLSSLRPTSDDGRWSTDPAAGLPLPVGNSPFSRTLLASSAGSASGTNGALLRHGSRATATAYYGAGASMRSSHFMGTANGLETLSPEGGPLAALTETQHSTFTSTFVVDESELVEWRRMSVLGKGSFGTVYEGITLDGKMIAVKVQELPMDDDAAEIKALQTEINLMRSLKHRNIVAYYGCQTRVTPSGGQQMEIFLELCHGGSLSTLRRKLIKTQHDFGISLVRSYTRQVLEGLAYLHAERVIHRDIKSDNVLISATGEAKLADFGCSKRFGGGTVQATPSTLPPPSSSSSAAPTAAAAPAAMYQTMVGSPFFMAPEVMREDAGGYTSAADIWSVGCLVIELLGREPWEVTGTNIFQIMFRIAREQGMPTGVPPNCPAALHSFFQRCFERDPAKRATAAELLEHEWMTCPDKMLEEVPAEQAAK